MDELDAHDDTDASRAELAADRIRHWLTDGELAPGRRLSEVAFAERLGVSRNTLRESFRILVHEGLLERRRNRGVAVVVPTPESIMDVFRVRRFIECRAVREGRADHPAVDELRDAISRARRAMAAGSWRDVGSANMAFHRALVDLADSPRLATMSGVVVAELRLVFQMLDDPRRLHEPYVARNIALLRLIEDGEFETAARELEDYLADSERNVLRAFLEHARA